MGNTTTKKRFKLMAALLGMSAVLVAFEANADTISKHPRVAELEDSLRGQASEYLRSRFPDQPFLVSVSVDPIRRQTGKNNTDSDGEQLPYFEAADNEITDEWDDPNASLHQLQLRTTKIAMEISLSENVSDGERAEVRDSLYQSLHLIPARDEIKVETRKWSSTRSYTYYFITGVAIILFFLIGFSIVQRYGYKRISQALSNIQLHNSGSGGGGAVAAPVTVPSANSSDDRTIFGGSGMEFSDLVKAREFMVTLVSLSEKTSVFPTLNTMVYFDSLGKQNPAALGALLMELPANLQKKIFSYGADQHWYESMLQPGHFRMESVELFQMAVREATFAHEAHVEEMLIRVWRMRGELDTFLRGLDREVALSILSLFPKDEAIKYARKAFPGGWADLLDPDYKATKFTPALSKEIGEKAEKMRPLLDFSKLSHYRQLSELMKFLQTASPDEEKEVYLISKSNSMLHQSRAPFYPILDASDDKLDGFVQSFNPQQWTLALFNVDRGRRKKILDAMQEKQRFLFIERLKQLDQNHPDPVQVGQMRELIAQKFKEHLSNTDRLDDALKAVAEGAGGIKGNGDQAA
ncbi:MAG: hypothetical protein JST80_01415 [Bdellovibrionales bacterium]|nr:hypothetical protein [Bdellovibrionales bacterium]